MHKNLAQVTLVVHDYDEAIAFFTQKLGFMLVENTPLSQEKRWVVVRPSATSGAALLLAKADTPEQQTAIGNQAGGRVSSFSGQLTSGATTTLCKLEELSSLKLPAWSPTARS